MKKGTSPEERQPSGAGSEEGYIYIARNPPCHKQIDFVNNCIVPLGGSGVERNLKTVYCLRA